MSRQVQTIEIGRPVGVVFGYMDDVDREAEWQPALQSATKRPSGPTGPGTEKTYLSTFMGRPVKNTYVVREFEEGRRIVYRTTRDSTIDATSEIVCEATPAGTMVTMSVEAKPKGVLRFVPTLLLESAARDELSATLSRLKRRLESTP